jgi:hypothetical protein
MLSLPHQFESRFGTYVSQVGRANSEATRGFLFLEFLRASFPKVGEDRADQADRLLPELEKVVSFHEGAVAIRGRIDALLSNVIIEFKTELNEASLLEAKRQLKVYTAALYEQNRRDFLGAASDGVKFYVYVPTVSADEARGPGAVQVRLDQVDSIDMSTAEAREVYLWLDRYLLAERLDSPTTEGFVREFGSSFFEGHVYSRLLLLWSREKSNYTALYGEWAEYLSIAYGTRVESERLFLRHTYLATLAKLTAYMMYSGTPSPSRDLTKALLDGQAFREWGIINFLEEDIFSWLGRHPEGIDIALGLVKRLSRFNMSRIEEDVLKGIYQNLVDPDERHDLGEYYTPEWIAEYMVSRLLQDDVNKSVLDPACGSGTFLAATIRYKTEHMKQRGDERLQSILANVVGIDIHPLAVAIAKTNYLLALRPLLKEARRSVVSLPIYLADSLRVEPQGRVVHGVRVYEKTVDEKNRIWLPALEEPSAIDELVDVIKKYASELAKRPDEKTGIETYLAASPKWGELLSSSRAGTAADITKLLQITGTVLGNLMRERGNTIWAFVLKNFYKPTLLLHRFDVVIGNPPWLSYRYIHNLQYQEDIKTLATKHFRLATGARNVTNMELATVYFLASAENYLRDGGSIGFVMPRSVFTGDQHDAFRKCEYEAVRLAYSHIDDLYKVAPIFKVKSGTVPTCVIFAEKGGKTQYPVTGHTMSGKLPGRNLSLHFARSNLTIAESEFFLIRQGKRSYIASEKPSIAVKEGQSYYYGKFQRGADIYPRQFYFVEIAAHPELGMNINAPFVRSSSRSQERAKEGYTGLKLEGNVESLFLYGTMTGSELLPFSFVDILPIVLPVQRKGDRYVVVTREWAERTGYPGLAGWLGVVEKEWAQRRREKASKANIYEWLNYRNKLGSQDSSAPLKVLYTKSGTHLAACIVDCSSPIAIQLNNISLPLQGYIAEENTYYYETADSDEAAYLVSVLNSSVVDTLVKPMQSRGLLGERHFHKKPLEFPIPKYDSASPSHCRLVELGQVCTAKAREKASRHQLARHLAKAREQLREILEPELTQIDALVRELLT